MLLAPSGLFLIALIIWALLLVVTAKYVLILLNADNNGEGGTLSLMALANRAMGKSVVGIAVLGMIGAALFYGDAMITPALSVLSAVEGLEVISPAFKKYVIPLTIVILFGFIIRKMLATSLMDEPNSISLTEPDVSVAIAKSIKASL